MESLIRIIMLIALFSVTGIAQGLTFKTLTHIPGADTNSEEGLSINKGGVVFIDYIAGGRYRSGKLYPAGFLPVRPPTEFFIGRNFSNAREVGGVGYVGSQSVGVLIKSTGVVVTYQIPGYRIIAGGSVNDLSHRVVTVRSLTTNVFSGVLRDNVGKVTILNAPGATSTWVESINDSDDIVGEWFDGGSIGHGFLWHAGEFTTIDVPGAIQTFCNGIGNNGWIVGNYIDYIDPTNHAFLYKDGQFIKFDYPVPPGTGLFFTRLNGVNETGVLVGTFLVTNPALVNGIERFAFTATLN